MCNIAQSPACSFFGLHPRSTTVHAGHCGGTAESWYHKALRTVVATAVRSTARGAPRSDGAGDGSRHSRSWESHLGYALEEEDLHPETCLKREP